MYRSRGRTVVAREVDGPLLVLGSAQPGSVVDEEKAASHGVAVARRRSGGGAVLLLPGAQVWVDVWVPRDDRLWSEEPRRVAATVGAAWAEALGRDAKSVYRGGSSPAVGSDLVCFAGVGPGEVLVDGRKLVGLAQWRSREGALVHGCAYRSWDPWPLLDLLAIDDAARHGLAAALATAATDLDAVGVPATWGVAELVRALPGPEEWDVGGWPVHGPATELPIPRSAANPGAPGPPA